MKFKDERLSETRRKIEKKGRKKNKNFDMDEVDKELQEIYDLLLVPTFKKTLPIRLVIWLFDNKMFVPKIIEIIKSKNEKKKLEDDQNVDVTNEAENTKKYEEAQAKRRRLVNDLNPKKVEKSSLSVPVVDYKASDKLNEVGSEDDSKIWTDVHKSALIKAVSRYPGGTADRWEKISKFVGKSSQQCIEMEKKLRTNFQASSSLNKTIGTSIQDAQSLISDDIMTMRDSDCEDDNKTIWSQDQQKLLENALKVVDKNVADRWERIAVMVPGKTKVIFLFL